MITGVVREIHSAYGITLKGEYQEYRWYDGRVDDVIWRIFVNDVAIYLGNGHFIINEDKTDQYINMQKDKDLLCFWLSRNPMDYWQLEEFFTKEYTSCWWRYKAQNLQISERIAEQRKKEAEARNEREQKQIISMQEYADKKHLYMIRDYTKVYFLKLDKKNAKAIGSIDDKLILEFAKNNPGHGCEIVETKEVVI